MTLQDAQTAEEEEPTPGVHDATAGLRRGGSRMEGTSDVVPNNPSKQKLGLQLQGLSNAELGLEGLSTSESAAVHSPHRVSHDSRGGVPAKSESHSTEGAVPPWRSNSAAAWVKQKSLDKSLSAKAFANWDQEEEQQPWLQQAEPDQAQAAVPQAGAEHSVTAPGRSPGEGQSVAASGRGRPQGSLRIDVEDQPQQDGLQEWTESGLDDIAAAVAQYTGALPDALLATEDTQQGKGQLPKQLQEQLPEQLHRQQHRQRPQEVASLRLTGLRSATQSPRGGAVGQNRTQQERMTTELGAATAFDAEPFAAHHDAHEETNAESNTAVMAERSVPKYANAQEQMEAELEAAMVAELSAPKYANAQEQMEAELEAAMAAELSAPKYANAQEQMEAELEAAMAADVAADADQDVQHARGDEVQSSRQWHQMDAELNAGEATAPQHPESSAQHGTPALYSSPSQGRAVPELPRDGLDLDADRPHRPRQLQVVAQKVRLATQA